MRKVFVSAIAITLFATSLSGCSTGNIKSISLHSYINAIEEHVGEGLIDILVANNFKLDIETLSSSKIDEEDVKTGAELKDAIEKYEEQEQRQLLLTDSEREEISLDESITDEDVQNGYVYGNNAEFASVFMPEEYLLDSDYAHKCNQLLIFFEDWFDRDEALKMVTGNYIGLLDHDDVLPIFAMYEIVKCINENPKVDLANHRNTI